jgi:CRISPR-associated protein Csy1
MKEDVDHLLKMISTIVGDNLKSKASLTTHSGKFTHPDSKVSGIVAKCSRDNDGYLRSGNVDTKETIDAVGNGAYNSALLNGYNVLSNKLGDYQSILEHLESESEEIRTLFAPLEIEFSQIKEKLSIILAKEPAVSDGRIRQVYFPLDDNDDYHVLSILPSSPIMSEMNNRIRDISRSEETKEVASNRKKNLYDERAYSSLKNLTQISFGGSNPVNITAINSKNAGKFYLLPSLPPVFKNSKIRIPKKDFFLESIWLQGFDSNFDSLHSCLNTNKKNLYIRNSRDSIIHGIIESIIETAFQIRTEAESRWSYENKHSKLPRYQKIWLDEDYNNERINESEWVEELADAIARWFIFAYEKLLKKQALKFADDELIHVRKLAEDIVKKMIRENSEFFI